MVCFATPEQYQKTHRELRARILNVLPAASLQMDRFFSLVDITLSRRTESAAVETGWQPRLHINPDFIDAYCQRDEHLLMLIMHEMYHIILGHSRLFPRATWTDNVVFDAVINALLCHEFQEEVYLEFFRNINGDEDLVSRLLRPPAGWPKTWSVHRDASEAERAVLERLYGSRRSQVTYQEIRDLLGEELKEEGAGSCVLLGAHGNGDACQMTPAEAGGDRPDGAEPGDQDEGDGRPEGPEPQPSRNLSDEAAIQDELFSDILRKTVEGWPDSVRTGLQRGLGQTAASFLLPVSRRPRAQFLAALENLLKRAGVLNPSAERPLTRRKVDREVDFVTFVPELRDRRSHTWTTITGESPLLYTSISKRLMPKLEPAARAHVYLDISGSMSDCLPWLTSALDPLEKKGLCRLFVFSTVVDSIRHRQLLRQRVQNTYGTDIGCVYEHVLSLPPPKTPRRIVILTDGYTGVPTRNQAREFAERKISVYVGVTHPASEYGGYYDEQLKPYAKVFERLPALPG